MSTLSEIEAATRTLPLAEKETLLVWLSRHLKKTALEASTGQHSVLDIDPVSIGEILCPFDDADDVLDEMLEERL